MIMASLSIQSSKYASRNRQEEWKRCCAAAMGFEWIDDDFDEVSGMKNDTVRPHRHHQDLEYMNPVQQVINLLDNSIEEEEWDDTKIDDDKDNNDKDHWTENALRIQADLLRMASWIRRKQKEYISVEMADEEASLIQSTVTSFAATTATELETLRSMISSSLLLPGSDIANHRAGVVQILLSQLQEQVAQPFSALQKQRIRMAVKLWQNPLQCRLYQPQQFHARGTNANQSSFMQLFEEEDNVEREQRFLPQRQSLIEEDMDFFMHKYSHKKELNRTPRPDFLKRLAKKSTFEVVPATKSDTRPMLSSKPMMANPKQQMQSMPQALEETTNSHLDEDLHQEAAMLMVSIQSDLDSVQKVEQRMVEITTLIGQFANLVSEQQEEIWNIHDSAEQTKENMDKGQENLINATERVKRSKHYMAKIVFAMSLTLLFFHILRN